MFINKNLLLLIGMFCFNLANSQILIDNLDSLYYQNKYSEIYKLYSSGQKSSFITEVKKIYLLESLINLKKYEEVKRLIEKDTVLTEIDKFDIVVNNKVDNMEFENFLKSRYIEDYCESNNYNREIVIIISRMFFKDQFIRAKHYVLNIKDEFPDENNNTIYLNNIVDADNFLSPKDVGKETIDRIILLIAHSKDIDLQRRFLKEIFYNVDYPNSIYGQDKAILTDKILLEELGFQLYGTQIEKTNSTPIPSKLLAPKQVNALRKEIGLNFTLETYINFFK